MSDGLDMFDSDNGKIVDINLDSKGELLPPKNNKTLLVDADTLIFTACLNSEIVEELLPQSFYSKEEWEEIVADATFDEDNHCRYFVFDGDIDSYIKDKLEYIMQQTGTSDYELHFTGNLRSSFRYKLYDMYKGNRKGGRAPTGLHDTKIRWVENNPSKCFIWDEWEADDIVVSLRRDNPNKYIMAAVDKDVLYSLPGRHFNYYTSAKYGIDMKWVEVDKLQAMKHHYIQALTGDSSDNIPGLNGIGAKRANKILEDCIDPVCMWEAVVEAYESKGKSVVDALITMRLVSMHQLIKDSSGEYKLNLWKPTTATYTKDNNGR